MIITPFSVFFSFIWGSILLFFLMLTKDILLKCNAYKTILLCSLLTLLRFLFIFDIPIDALPGIGGKISMNITLFANSIFKNIPFFSQILQLRLWENFIWETLLIIWGIGILLLLKRDIINFKKIRESSKTCMGTWTPPEPYIIKKLELIQQELKIDSEVKLIQSNFVEVPFIQGIIHPTIYLGNINESELDFILRHELTHLLYHDNWFKLFVHIVSVIFWWNPLIRALPPIVEDACEYRCDKRVTQNIDMESKLEYASIINQSRSNNKVSTGYLDSALLKKEDHIQKRICAFLQPEQVKTPLKILYGIIFSIIIIVSLVFCFPTIEQYSYLSSIPTELKGNSANSYFIKNENGYYSLYISGVLINSNITNPEIYDIPIINEK